MEQSNPSFKRRSYLITAGAVATGVVGLAGCTDGEEGTGVLSTRITDQPGDIGDFESCIVTIEGIWIKPGDAAEEDGTEDEEGVQEQDEEDIDEGEDREYHAFEEPQEADLVQLQDGETQLLDEDRELPTGSYEFLQLDVSGVEGTLVDGEEVTVDTPGNAPLQFKLAFEIREDERTIFTADVTPVRRGQTDEYLLQPVADNLSVTYEAIEDEEENTDEE